MHIPRRREFVAAARPALAQRAAGLRRVREVSARLLICTLDLAAALTLTVRPAKAQRRKPQPAVQVACTALSQHATRTPSSQACPPCPAPQLQDQGLGSSQQGHTQRMLSLSEAAAVLTRSVHGLNAAYARIASGEAHALHAAAYHDPRRLILTLRRPLSARWRLARYMPRCTFAKSQSVCREPCSHPSAQLGQAALSLLTAACLPRATWTAGTWNLLDFPLQEIKLVSRPQRSRCHVAAACGGSQGGRPTGIRAHPLPAMQCELVSAPCAKSVHA